jgi:hypothetical protein
MSLIATWFTEGRRALRPIRAIRWVYADGGFSGGNMERPPHTSDFIEVVFHPKRRRRPTASLDGSWVE